MKLSKRKTLLMGLLLISLIATSCRSLRKEVYVPPGKAVEVRENAWVPVWVKDSEGKIIRGWVRAGQYWRLGPPPWVRKEGE